MPNLDKVLATLDADRQGALDRLFELSALQSISTVPVHAPDCAAAADWLVGQLRSLGFDAASRPTAGHPDRRRQGQGGASRRAPCADLRPLRRPAGRSARSLADRPLRSAPGRKSSPAASRSSPAAPPTTRAS